MMLKWFTFNLISEKRKFKNNKTYENFMHADFCFPSQVLYLRLSTFLLLFPFFYSCFFFFLPASFSLFIFGHFCFDYYFKEGG